MMSTELVAFNAEPAELEALSTEALRKHLVDAIGITAHTLAHMGRIWRELERRGEDLSDLRTGLMVYMPLIAAGSLAPELVVRCAGQAMVLKAASELPVDMQQRLLTEGVSIVDIDATGAAVERTVPIDQLRAHQIRQVFQGAKLRTPVEQISLLSAVRKARASSTKMVNVTLRLSRDEYKELQHAANQQGQRVATYLRVLIRKSDSAAAATTSG